MTPCDITAGVVSDWSNLFRSRSEMKSDIEFSSSQPNSGVYQYKIWRTDTLHQSKIFSILTLATIVSAIFFHNRLGYWFLIAIIWLLFIMNRRRSVKEETMTVIEDLGIQLESVSFGGKKRYRFVEKEKIKQVFINEAVQTFRIVSYLAFIVKGESKLTLAFERHIEKNIIFTREVQKPKLINTSLLHVDAFTDIIHSTSSNSIYDAIVVLKLMNSSSICTHMSRDNPCNQICNFSQFARA
ncbi:phosphatidylinositol N-acetylglucosaminyltransferase subunit H-like [Planoprotostelium fungivorum]|uniref:Phosphatidylinositol N-acetylglucosaminyltransferase subunit H-like n=1 Tax=Planoprotostelium fungivorum TaxID=1890364 RepID=A0A2P6N4W5_9EUKA|nr:phosphatidylinositol N-acetylglucosaminyltransferase subunit H-like [Planoprotostelium fungivorum]